MTVNFFITLLLILLILKTLSFKFLNPKIKLKESVWDSLYFATHIFVQQIFLLMFWNILLKIYIEPEYRILILAVVFFLAHIRLLFIYKKFDAFIFLMSSFLGGLVFGYIFNNYFVGIYITYLMHMFFHITLDFIFILFGRTAVKENRLYH